MPRLSPESLSQSQSVPNPIRRATAPVVEALENRQMMSVSPITFDKHRVTIEGTKAADDIRVYLSDDSRIVNFEYNGEVIATRTASKVNRVTIYGRSGDDMITFEELNRPKITKIHGFLYGGRGNDTITGGSADDAITGGKGDDDIAGGGGNNHMFGNGGTDTIEGVIEGTQAEEAYTAAATTAAVTGRAVTPSAVSIPSFIVRDLGLVPRGIGDRIPFAINDEGDVVGVNLVDDDGDQQTPLLAHGFIRYTANPRMRDVGTLNDTIGSTSWVWDLNNNIPGLHGVELGGMSQPGGVGTPQFGVFWDQNLLPNDIGFIQFGNILGRAGNTIIYGINDGGLHLNHGNLYVGAEIVGESNGEAFYMPDITGPIYFMGPNLRPAGVVGRSVDINNNHITIGFQSTTQHAWHAYQDGPITDMGTLPNTTVSSPYDINNNANYMIVGVSDENQPRQTAWKWQAGRMRALSKPQNSRTSAYGVNDAEVKVGTVITRVGQADIQHAAMWLPDPTRPADVFVDLAQLTGLAGGRTLTAAHAINNSNEVIAEGFIGGTTGNPINGQANGPTKHAFLLTPGRLADFGNKISFQGNVIKPLNSVLPGSPTSFDPRLVYNVFGKVDYKVKKNSVNLDLLTIDVARKQFPSMGLVDWVFPTPGKRALTDANAGTGRFSIMGAAFVTLEDGTIADFNVRFEGTTFRRHKQDYVRGTFAAVSSHGRILKQGKQAVFTGTFGPN
jgi:Ca2+-binding RTX toxin-like protein